MNRIEQTIQARLFEMQDLKYRDFQCKLMPTVEPERVIGVRIPQLRGYAKELSKTPEEEGFLKILPHKYYEEYNLHGFLIETMKDYDMAVRAIDTFLPYVDNWATCDIIRPKVFKKHLPQLFEQIKVWIESDWVYTIRYGIAMLMSYYLDEYFEPEYLELVAGVESMQYYVNMIRAWYFAMALAKQYEAALPYIEQQLLDPWTHNKAIKKAIESYRITDEQKEYLRKYKVRTK